MAPPCCRELVRSSSSWQLDAKSNSRVHTGATRELLTANENLQF